MLAIKTLNIKTKKSHSNNKRAKEFDQLLLLAYKNTNIKSTKKKKNKERFLKQKFSIEQPKINKCDHMNQTFNLINLPQPQKDKNNLREEYTATIKHAYNKITKQNLNSNKKQISNKDSSLLPQAAWYFLGSVLQKIKKNGNAISFNEFEQECQRIYKKSLYEDIKCFIELMNKNYMRRSISKQNKVQYKSPIWQKQYTNISDVEEIIRFSSSPNPSKSNIEIIQKKESNKYQQNNHCSITKQETNKKVLGNIPITASIESKKNQQTPVSYTKNPHQMEDISRVMNKIQLTNFNSEQYRKCFQAKKQIGQLTQNIDKTLWDLTNKISIKQTQPIKVSNKKEENTCLSSRLPNNPNANKFTDISYEAIYKKPRTSRIHRQTDRIGQLSSKLQKLIQNNAIKIENSKNIRNLL